MTDNTTKICQTRMQRMQERYDELMAIGKHGHYESMFQVWGEEFSRLSDEKTAMSPETTDRRPFTRTIFTPNGYLKFEWRPDPGCPICKGEGQAWHYRTYGDPQYHGMYREDCDHCAQPPRELKP